MRTLFVIPFLPRPIVSVARAIAGDEALSGTLGSGVLALEGLARRGHQVAAFVLDGRSLVEGGAQIISSAEEARRWVGDGRVIWLYQGNDAILNRLNNDGLIPSVWAEVHVSRDHLQWLEMGRIREILTVSDTARLPLLRSPLHERIGRIYNALSPAFEASTPSVDDASPHRFTNKRIVFSGSPTENKGAHRLLAMWSHVREADPSAVLQLAGTGRLYGDSRPIGPYGISPPEFESKHIAPLVAKFGSLDAAGIEPLGLLTPNELRQVYEGSTLGIVNLNWRNYTETFCCAAVEMLAAGLPVFSVARGALPEVIGSSSGAYLSKTESVEREAKELLMLLSNSRRLAEMGAAGLTYARREYGWARIIRQWEDVLASASDIEAVSGEWRGPVGLRYWLERGSGRLGMGRLLERMPKHRFSGPTQ